MQAKIALYTHLISKFGEQRVFTNQPLSRHCNWKVGGPADIFFTAKDVSELIEAVRSARLFKQPVTILGFGANVLVSDRGIRGLVILNRAERIVFHPDYVVEADSGTNLALLARRAAEQGVGGLEILIGIPGTVGAAVFGNAGTREQWMSHILNKVRVLTREGQDRILDARQIIFDYRSSSLKQSGDIVLTAWLKGYPGERATIENKMQELLDLRQNQPGGPSTGSVFKNPPGDFAGRLIEACGLKGYRIGGAEISEMHANFILNRGHATASDIRALIRLAKSRVVEKFGIKLKEEIRYLGEWDEALDH